MGHLANFENNFRESLFCQAKSQQKAIDKKQTNHNGEWVTRVAIQRGSLYYCSTSEEEM